MKFLCLFKMLPNDLKAFLFDVLFLEVCLESSQLLLIIKDS
jgi:hypothetical protein